MSRPELPLAGIRVVDCSTVLAGPYCTMVLADLGAEVIKVEPPEGDSTRGWGPPWVGNGANRTAAYYLAINRNKRSIALDLRTPWGAGVLRRLLAGADVLVENFRAGALERLGFGDVELQRLRPGMVHLAISGYGVTGPEASKPGYDFVAQAVGGLMSITGAPDAAAGEPTKVGVAVSDVATGLFGAIGVLAALIGRGGAGGVGGAGASGASGPGGAGGAADAGGAATVGSRAAPGGSEGAPEALGARRVDVSLLESTIAILINQAQNAFVSGVSPGRRGNSHPNIVPYELFDTADRPIVIAVGSERQWPRFCDVVGLPDLAPDARFATNADRVLNREALRAILAPRLRMRDAGTWLAALDAADVPCGPVNDILDAVESAQSRARGMDARVMHPVLGEVRQTGVPIKLDGATAAPRSAPPLLGEHGAEILRELGYDDAAIDAMAITAPERH